MRMQENANLKLMICFLIESPDSFTEAEDCIEMWLNEGWNDAECYWPKSYICQVPASKY